MCDLIRYERCTRPASSCLAGAGHFEEFDRLTDFVWLATAVLLPLERTKKTECVALRLEWVHFLPRTDTLRSIFAQQNVHSYVLCESRCRLFV